jgi:molybdopterin-guanine dinucleotide biosynthesis protein A
MNRVYKDITGVILAGGKSSRMGSAKEFLSVNGKPMLDNVLDVLHPLFYEIFVVTNDKKRFPNLRRTKVVEDLVRGSGPLGGIYTGLRTITCEKAFFVACDMPFLHNALIRKLLDCAGQSDYDCVIPRSTKGPEPLHAVYSRKIIQRIEESLKGKDLSIVQLIKRCRCKYFDVTEEEASSFLNINTPQDLKEIETYARKIQSVA